ncbi:hypothetical protein ES707_10079 [subsurface metagenome]
MNKNARMGLGAILAVALSVSAFYILNPRKKLFDEEVTYYTELADSELWCSLVRQPEEHTWEFYKSYYDVVISKWERVSRTELRIKIMEHHNRELEEHSSGVIIIRIVESDMVIFFFHAIPDTPDAGITYWKR